MSTRSPPAKYTVGIDSIHLRFKNVNKYDIDRFCKHYALSYKYKTMPKGIWYQQSWHIFLEGGQPITATYHSATRSMKFEIGKLMNYSITREDHHQFVQNVMYFFRDRELSVSRIDIAVDANHPAIFVSRFPKQQGFVQEKTTLYRNASKRTFVIYDKVRQLKLYSIKQMTRYELRLTGKLGEWKVKDFIDNRDSFLTLVGKAQKLFDFEYLQYREHGSLVRLPESCLSNLLPVMENFIAFLHGGDLPPFKDHFKVPQAIANRDIFFQWMRRHNLHTITDVRRHIKGKRSVAYKELEVTHKTFNKALSFYEGIPNFKV